MTRSRELAQERDQTGIRTSGTTGALAALAAARKVLPWLVAVGWLACLAAIATLKPGELLELVVLTAVAPLAWWVARNGGGVMPVALVLFLVPLVDTWPARVLQLVPNRLHVPLPAFLSLGSVVIALAIMVVHPRWRSVPTWFLAVGIPFLLAGALSSIAAHDHLDAFGQAWLAFAVPIGLGALVASTRPTWTVATTLLLGFVTPALVGIAAYLLSFGLPLSGADLVNAKVELYRPHLFQDLTYGNVGHIADLALLLLPLAFLAPVAWWRDRLMRFVSIIVALVILVVLILVLSRSTLVVALAMLTGVAALLAIRRHWGAVAPAVGVATIALVLFLPDVRGLYAGILPTASSEVARAAPSPSPLLPSPGVSPSPVVQSPPAESPSPVSQSPPAATPSYTAGPVTVVGSASDTSTSDRIEAIRQGIRVASAHALFGVGTGQYVRFNATPMAPHSLLVLLIVENGVLGGLGLVLLLIVLSARALRIAWSRTIDDGAVLQLGALAGAFGFIIKGILAGVPLSLGTIDVWAACLWSLVAIGMAPTDPRPPSTSELRPSVRRVAPFAVAFVVLAVIAIIEFPLALQPGSADRDGVTLNSLVDTGNQSGSNDWFRTNSNLVVSGNGQRMELVLSRPTDVQTLVLSRPIPVFPSTCYDVSVSQITSTTPVLIALADEEASHVITAMSLPSGQSNNVQFLVHSGSRYRVSILFVARGPIDVKIGVVRVNRLSSCH